MVPYDSETISKQNQLQIIPFTEPKFTFLHLPHSQYGFLSIMEST